MTMMKSAVLTRIETGDQGTFGKLEAGSFTCVTLELPWRDNAPDRSCVPAGVYFFRMVNSPKHGWCYEEYDDPSTPRREDVPGREHIQIHAANVAGDVEKGYLSELLGCIAPGMSVVTFLGGQKPAGNRTQKGVNRSREALKNLEETLNREIIELTIAWSSGVGPGPGPGPAGRPQ